jgi:hypothetical protein
MSDAPDPLEAELSALRPRAVSPDLRRHVADRLNAPPARHRWAWGLALAGLVIAAGVVVLIAPGPKKLAPPVPPAVVPAPTAPTELESPAPTVLTFNRALARSPEDLDALLDRQAATSPDPAPMPAATWTRSPAALDALLGDD